MKKVINGIAKAQLVLAAIFFIVFIFCVILQVASRYIPGIAVFWASTIATYSFIWMVFFGAAITLRDKEHFKLSILLDKLRGLPLLVLQMIIQVILIWFGYVMVTDGYQISQQFWGWTVNSMPQLKQGYIWLVLPITGITFIIYALESLIEEILNYRKHKGGYQA
ncbi:TRAP transporter small permease [Sediminibacillus albus]|uniref:TRAP-type C4-dicarboxylate transport system, small permease component n=1 Tax=Sediminibacillus albus TaxID=407036 RepID=A0A1G8YL33_9BACI|nr:TRAP transporter small permease [Sediminibacillus albus]SDK03377.1 TRAP-type C4-dicarboxylate transport system, small permease component [Sediminibacillus albus]